MTDAVLEPEKSETSTMEHDPQPEPGPQSGEPASPQTGPGLRGGEPGSPQTGLGLRGLEPARNSAVAICDDAAQRAHADILKNGGTDFQAREAGSRAYREAMPDPSDFATIRDFIATVTHGMVIGVLDQVEAPKLLYAAQVALSAARREPKAPARPAAA